MAVLRGPDSTTVGAQVLETDFVFAFEFPEWHKDAACLEHPEVEFFPTVGQSAAPAKRVCQGCLVQAECLAFALDQGPTFEGTWGGTSRRERAELLKSGKVTAELVAHWGPLAMHGREFMRDRDYDAQRWAEIMANVPTKAI